MEYKDIVWRFVSLVLLCLLVKLSSQGETWTDEYGRSYSEQRINCVNDFALKEWNIDHEERGRLSKSIIPCGTVNVKIHSKCGTFSPMQVTQCGGCCPSQYSCQPRVWKQIKIHQKVSENSEYLEMPEIEEHESCGCIPNDNLNVETIDIEKIHNDYRSEELNENDDCFEANILYKKCLNYIKECYTTMDARVREDLHVKSYKDLKEDLKKILDHKIK